MRKLNSIVRITIPLVALALGGCSYPSLVGTWQTVDLLSGQAKVSYDFRADGTFKSEVELNTAGMPIPINASGEGSYKLEKGRLVAEINHFTIPGLPDATTSELRRKLPRIGRRPIAGSLQWQSRDSFILIEDVRGTTMVFRRVKAK